MKTDGCGVGMACRGLIGPTRQFGSGSLYHGHLWALLVGALLPCRSGGGSVGSQIRVSGTSIFLCS